MTVAVDKFRVREGKKIRLGATPTRVAPLYSSKKDYESLLDGQIDRMRELQNVLYADNRFSLLLIFQAMDAAGKDSAIKHVMSGVNPQGCQVYSFKHPSAEELDHDFLWRTNRSLPERGRIGIFNRSYYEEVLIVRVHPEILKSQNLPDHRTKQDNTWKDRYRSIVDMEDHLHRNGTRIVKFFLHLSKEEQRKRFLARLDDPKKKWKFSASDVDERKFWNQYQYAYEDCLNATSTKTAPWYAVPADDKQNARLIISRVIVKTLSDLGLEYPKVDKARVKELQAIRKQLSK